MSLDLQGRVAAWVFRRVRHVLRRDRTEWATAMEMEADACASPAERLAWAGGCWRAAVRVTAPKRLFYPLTLAAGLTALAAYEWSTDESLTTVALAAALAAALGLLRPGSALLSGLAIGSVVTAVTGFEAITGVRPSYETQSRTLGDCLHWTVLLLPALFAAMAGGTLGKALTAGRRRG